MLFESRKPTLSRKFTRASGHYMATSATPLTAAPVTLAAWVFPLNDTTSQDVITVTDTAASANAFRLNLGGATAGDPIRAVTSAGASNPLSSTGTFTLNKWQHAAAVFASATSRVAYYNGSAGTVETTSATPAGIDAVLIGRVGTGAAVTDLDGYVAWPAVWNVALSAEDIYALWMGAHPTTIHPEGLVCFWDFSGTNVEFGRNASYPLTNNGSVVAPGPSFLSTPTYRPWTVAVGGQPSTGNRRRRFLIASS